MNYENTPLMTKLEQALHDLVDIDYVPESEIPVVYEKAFDFLWKNGADIIATIKKADIEINNLHNLCNLQQQEISNLSELADCKETLREIGSVIGCNHVESPDERRQLVNCVEFQKLKLELRLQICSEFFDQEIDTLSRDWYRYYEAASKAAKGE